MRTKVQLQLSTNFAWTVSAHHRGMHNTTAHSLCKISANLCCFHRGHWLDEPLASQIQTRKLFGRSRAALTSPAPPRATDWFHFNTLRTGDADLRFYITTVQDGWRKSAFLTRACFPCTIHLIRQYIEPVSEWSCWRMFIKTWPHSELTF